ncbi:sigma factor-like helix-turn-helix DNA-binding protein [Streptomyces spongiicola]|uniref:sigma factor-like helix-turn-helix DNA-binding protein n=1 Tax=Streptomyces spongiicola TaxID=1690221 RepID=UPI003F4D2E79
MTKSTADSTEEAVPPLPPPKERRRLREAKALSEAELAEVLGVTKATVRAWETGRGDPRGRKREAYATLLAAYEAESSPRKPGTDEDHGADSSYQPGRAGGAEQAGRTGHAGETGHAGRKPWGRPALPPEGRPGAVRRPGRAEPAGNAATGRAPGGTGTTATGAPVDKGPARAGEHTAGGPTADPAATGGPAESSAGSAAPGYRKAGAHPSGAPVPPPPLEPPRPYPGTALARAADEQHEGPRQARCGTQREGERGGKAGGGRKGKREESAASARRTGGEQRHGQSQSQSQSPGQGQGQGQEPEQGQSRGQKQEQSRGREQEQSRGQKQEQSRGREQEQSRGKAAGRVRPAESAGTARPTPPSGTSCPTGPSRPGRPPESAPPPARDRAALTAEQAFDELYDRTAPGLARQTLLLTGRESLSLEAVERAFHLAWQRWPEVAVDRDPGGWARAAAYDYALSPWHGLRRAHRRPDPVASARPAAVAYPGGRTLREALLGLPPSYRRTLLLYDGLGLDLPETAAETEASTPAAANRLLNARAAMAEQIPELAEPEALQHELSDLVENLATPRLSPAHSVRGGSERRAELWTRAAIGLTVLILGAAAVTMAVTEDHYEPPQAPGERVGGVPPRHGPEPYSKEDHRLRVQLRSHPAAGPARLVPLAR